MRLIWVLNTFRYSAIELTVKSFIENKKVRENIDLIILQIDDKKNNPAQEYINQLKSQGVKFETIEYKTFLGIPRFEVLIKTFKLIALIKPDLLHIYCERFSFYLGICSRILKIPTVRTVCHIFDLGNGIIPKIRRISKIIQRYFLRRMQVKFLTCSDTNAVHESKYYFNKGAKPIYNWFDPNIYNLKLKDKFELKINSTKNNGINIATIGGNWDYKNFNSLIKAIRLIKDNNPEVYNQLEYKQVGSNNKSLISLAKNLDVNEKCFFLGSVEDWRPYICNSDFLIAPSSEEGLNLSVIEASAFGLIPILSKRKCLNEHKRLGKDVIWLDDIDPYSIYKKIISLNYFIYKNLDDSKERISNNSYNYYSSEKLIPQLLNIYNSCMK